MLRPPWKTSLLGGAALALALGSVQFAMAATDLPIDEYLCYQAKNYTKVPGSAKFTGAEISTKDDFETEPFRNYLAAKHVSLCNPISSPSSPDTRPDVHLVEYAVKESKGFLNGTKFIPDGVMYTLSDRIGNYTPVTIVKPKSVLVRSAKSDYGSITKCKVPGDCTGGDTCQAGLCLPTDLSSPAAPGDLSGTADYTCYSVKAPKLAKGLTATASGVDIDDQFSYPQEYELKKITKVCAPTTIGAPNPGSPTAPTNSSHLVCYQAKALKGTGPVAKFLARSAAISDPNIIVANDAARFLEVKKQTEICVPALRTPDNNTPTTMTFTSQQAGGTCGTITVNMPSEGVPNRLNPATGEDDNADCTGAGVPYDCCEDVETGHCNEATTLTCGSLAFGGGGPAVSFAAPEVAQSPDQLRRFGLTCASATDTACTITGHPGDLANGVNCTQAGCGFLPPLQTDVPLSLCATIKLGSPASGSVNLQTGDMSLNVGVNVAVYVGSTCSRCRTSVAGGTCSVSLTDCFVTADCPMGETCSVNNPAVFSTGPTSPGIGVCDASSSVGTQGNTCYVFEPAGENAGLSAQCSPPGTPLNVPINVPVNTGSFSFSEPNGHFCPGQAGNVDCTFGNASCTGSGAPQACCTGVGMGSCVGQPQACCSGAGMGTCNNFNGCFGSANSSGSLFPDIPATCTGVSGSGSAAGQLLTGLPGHSTVLAGENCVSAIGGALGPTINNALGIPSKVVATQKTLVEVQ